MVVEDHRGRDDREQPAHRGLGPGLPVQGAVLGEVRDLVAGRGRRVAAAGDELPGGGPGVVGVDLVADQQQGVGPACRGLPGEVLGPGSQRVRAMAGVRLGAVRRIAVRLGAVRPGAARTGPGAGPAAARPGGQLGDPAGTEGEPQRPAGIQGPQHAGPPRAAGFRPADGAVQRHLVLGLGPRRQAVDHHQRVVVPGDLERPRLAAEGFHLTFAVGFNPDRDRGLVDVAEQRAKHKPGPGPATIGHAAPLPKIGPRIRGGGHVCSKLLRQVVVRGTVACTRFLVQDGVRDGRRSGAGHRDVPAGRHGAGLVADAAPGAAGQAACGARGGGPADGALAVGRGDHRAGGGRVRRGRGSAGPRAAAGRAAVRAVRAGRGGGRGGQRAPGGRADPRRRAGGPAGA